MPAESMRRTQPALADSKMGDRVARDAGRLWRLSVTPADGQQGGGGLFLQPWEWNPTHAEEPGRGGLLGVLRHPQWLSVIFKKTFHFELTSDLQKCCKDYQEFSYALRPGSPNVTQPEHSDQHPEVTVAGLRRQPSVLRAAARALT